MTKRVKQLPRNAVYDYTDICGREQWHTALRNYEVVKRQNCRIIYSSKR